MGRKRGRDSLEQKAPLYPWKGAQLSKGVEAMLAPGQPPAPADTSQLCVSASNSKTGAVGPTQGCCAQRAHPQEPRRAERSLLPSVGHCPRVCLCLYLWGKT